MLVPLHEERDGRIGHGTRVVRACKSFILAEKDSTNRCAGACALFANTGQQSRRIVHEEYWQTRAVEQVCVGSPQEPFATGRGVSEGCLVWRKEMRVKAHRNGRRGSCRKLLAEDDRPGPDPGQHRGQLGCWRP